MNKLLISLILLACLSFCSCDDTPTFAERSIFTISDDITVNTTWSEGCYIIDKEKLYIKAQLTINQGVVVKVMNYGDIVLGKEGSIICNGTRSKPVYFTSINDDNHGGDTNHDGDTNIPAAGDWGSINLNGTQNSQFTYCKFLYGGSNTGNPSTVDVSSEACAKFNNCTFAYNSGGYLNNTYYIGALNAANADKNTTISECEFYSNKYPITINASMSLDNSNTFSHNTYANTYNGIFVYGDFVKTDISWLEDEVPFVITSTNLEIARGNSLSLGNNTVLKFSEGSTLTIQSGEDYLINHDGQNVFFTSIKDDEHKGDTNGDGNSTAPKEGDWTGIYLDNWKSTSGYADWSNILYANPHAIAKQQ